MAWAARIDRRGGRSRSTDSATIELQRQHVANDAKFLERVIAHEMIHHRNYLDGTEDEKHGDAFREGAARINAIMGPDFVVEKIKPLTETASRDHARKKSAAQLDREIADVLGGLRRRRSVLAR